MINFLNDYSLIISLILILIILFTVIFRRIRKYVYSSFITSFIPVLIAVLNELGFNFNFSLIIFDKLILIQMNLLDRLQNLLLNQRDSLFLLVNAENEMLVLSLDFVNNLYSNIKMILINFKIATKATKLYIYKNIVIVKQEIVKRINLSRLTLVYRL